MVEWVKVPHYYSHVLALIFWGSIPCVFFWNEFPRLLSVSACRVSVVRFSITHLAMKHYIVRVARCYSL